MIQKTIKLIAIGLLLITSFGIEAQDIHFSQVFNNPLYLNPANAGMTEKKNRLVGFYRDQWRSVPVKYSSTILSYDRNVLDKNGNRVGAGIHFMYDKVGNGGLSTMKFDFSGAYGKFLNEEKQLLSIGFQVGFAQRSVDISKLTFGNQENNFEGDPSISSGENFNEKLSFADLALGVGFKTKIKEKSDLDLGFTVFNLTNPDNGFSEVITADRGFRFGTYVSSSIQVVDQWALKPGFYFQNQTKNRAYLLQLLAAHQFKNSKKPTELSFGALYRVKDAIIAYAGIDFNAFLLGVSYDINASSFADATGHKGGLEVSLQYQFERKKKEVKEIVEEEPVIIKEEENIVVEEVVEEIPKGIEPPVQTQIEFEGVKESIVNSVELMRAQLPVRIFFDNDQPNPNTNQTTTNRNYEDLLTAYDKKIDQYLNTISNERVERFYSENIEKGGENLNLFVQEISKVLAEGHQVKLVIQGYTSAIGKEEYNQNLSARRIVSVQNYLAGAEEGILQVYVNNGQLKIVTESLGESKTEDIEDAIGIWDHLPDNKLNPKNAYDRRVEILEVVFTKE